MTEAPKKVDLNLSKGCCGDGVKLKGQIGPFNRIIALEFGGNVVPGGDRPVVGVARCATCGDSWKFVRLGHNDSTTAYSLATMPANSLTTLEQAFSKLKKPSWPIWVPPTEAQMKDKEREAYSQLESTVLDKASSPSLVFATKHIANGRVLACEPYREDVKDWLAHFNLK